MHQNKQLVKTDVNDFATLIARCTQPKRLADRANRPIGPTVTPIHLVVNYDRNLVQMREAAGQIEGSAHHITDKNFPIDPKWSYPREFCLVGFHWDIKDHDDADKSELMKELSALELQPEGPPELLALAETYPDLQKSLCLLARRQLFYLVHEGRMFCPLLNTGEDWNSQVGWDNNDNPIDKTGKRIGWVKSMGLEHPGYGWTEIIPYAFLTSRK